MVVIGFLEYLEDAWKDAEYAFQLLPHSSCRCCARACAVEREMLRETVVCVCVEYGLLIAPNLTWHQVSSRPLDLAAHRVQRNGRSLHLGPTEYRLLEFLMQHPRRVFTREELLNAVWGPDIHVEPRTVDVHIRRLRKAINGEGEMDVVRTVRAAGYSLDTEPV